MAEVSSVRAICPARCFVEREQQTQNRRPLPLDGPMDIRCSPFSSSSSFNTLHAQDITCAT